MLPAIARIVVVGVLALVGLEGAAPQRLAGLQANWRDLETWSRLIESPKQNELGLGLQPEGPAVIAFLGRLSISDPRRPPAEVQAHVAPTYMANASVLRTATVTFLADVGTPKEFKLDLGRSLITDDPTPGGIIRNGLATLRASDFIRLTEATTLNGNILSFDVVFRPDQIRAMRAFAERLYLVPPPARP